MNRFAIVLTVSALLAGCATLDYGPEPTTTRYTEPAQSGLIGLRPFPTPDDVCQVIGENSLTNPFLGDASLLVGCPKHERVAIAMRLREGGQIVAQAKHWTLISMPLR